MSLLHGLDHSLAVTSDLDAAATAYRQLGFTLTPRGRHHGWGTANYCIMFVTGYMELLGIIDDQQDVNGLDTQLMARGPGVSGVAFATPDARAVYQKLNTAGLADRHQNLSRLLEAPDGADKGDDAETLEFSLAYAKPGVTPGLPSFFCQHRTRQKMRQPAWLAHPNGAVGLEGMTMIDPDPPALELAYRRLLMALDQPADGIWPGKGRLDVPIGDTQTLRFLSPARAAKRYPGVSASLLNRPGPLVVTLSVSSLTDTQAFMAARGIESLPGMGDRFVVAPEQADGTIIEFTA
ncbi:MAG: VOC family protein [Pseudomonadota bacterium]